MSQIKGFVKTSYVDYPGNICSVIFLSGCNFRCNYCYNKDLVFDSDSLNIIPEEEIFDFLLKRKNIIDGVCITGGEPTLYTNLLNLIQKLKSNNFKVKLDTNGSNPEIVKKIIKSRLVDYYAIDIKETFREYKNLVSTTWDPTAQISETIKSLILSNSNFEIRTTIIKNIHSIEKIRELMMDIEKMVGTEYAKILNWYLQPFRAGECINEQYNTYEESNDVYMEQVLALIKPTFSRIKIR